MAYTYEPNVKKSDFTFWFNAPHPYDFSTEYSPAHFVVDGETVDLDLMIQSVSIDYKENNSISPHLGETFSLTMFGKTPTTATIQAALLDSQDGCGKNDLVIAYRDSLRAAAVARTKKIPSLRMDTQEIFGPLTSMSLTLSSNMHGVWNVTLVMQLMKYSIEDADGITVFDYTVGEDAPIRILNAAGSSGTKLVESSWVSGAVSDTVASTSGTSTVMDSVNKTANETNASVSSNIVAASIEAAAPSSGATSFKFTGGTNTDVQSQVSSTVSSITSGK